MTTHKGEIVTMKDSMMQGTVVEYAAISGQATVMLHQTGDEIECHDSQFVIDFDFLGGVSHAN